MDARVALLQELARDLRALQMRRLIRSCVVLVVAAGFAWHIPDFQAGTERRLASVAGGAVLVLVALMEFPSAAQATSLTLRRQRLEQEWGELAAVAPPSRLGAIGLALTGHVPVLLYAAVGLVLVLGGLWMMM